MICEVCNKNEANIVFQVLNNGKLSTKTICAECAMKAQHQFFKTLHALGMEASENQPETKEAEKEKMPEKFCATCGQAVKALDDETQLGCPGCYQAQFREVCDMIYKQKPAPSEAAKQNVETDTNLEQMAHKLREAIVSEDYEQAAALRDRIKEAECGGETTNE